MLKRLAGRVRDVEGQAITDLGLILALVTVVCAGALTLFGENFDATLDALFSLF